VPFTIVFADGTTERACYLNTSPVERVPMARQLVRSGIAGARVSRYLQAADYRLIIPRDRKVDSVVQRALFQIRQNAIVNRPRSIGIDRSDRTNNCRWGKDAIGSFIVMHRKRDLFQMVAALHSSSGFAGGLHGRQ